MARLFAALPLMLALSVTRLASAQDRADVLDEETPSGSSDDDSLTSDEGGESSTIHFGLRLAYGIPFGDVSGSSSSTTTVGGTTVTVTQQGASMKDVITGQIPIWLDLGWQATRAFMVGGYFSYGFVLLSSDVRDGCDARGESCSAGDIRAGLQVQFSFAPGKSVDPWIGAGLGYEWLRLKGNQTSTSRGWEIPMLQGGLDFPAGKSWVGPFIAFTNGRYSRVDRSTNGGTQSDDVPTTASHQWLFLGVRGAMK
jgi:hypothetical protein